MLDHISDSAAPVHPLIGSDDPITAFVDRITPLRGQHVLVAGPGALAVMCAVAARGGLAVMDVRASCLPAPPSVGLAIAPNVFCFDTAEAVILRARAIGRVDAALFLRLAPGATLAAVRRIRGCLRANGFGAGQPHGLVGRLVLVAGCELASGTARRPV